VIWGVLLGFGGVLVAAVTLVLRERLIGPVRLAALGIGGVAVGVGAIGLQESPSTVEWLLTPVVLGALAVLHDRLVFAGGGPRRT
jgi:hypothetical protein